MIVNISRDSLPFGTAPSTEKAVMVVTTAMPNAVTGTPENAIVSDTELLTGQTHAMDLKPGQFLTITVYQP